MIECTPGLYAEAFILYNRIPDILRKGRISMNRVNYQKELDRLLDRLRRERESAEAAGLTLSAPRLFLHSCCAPCSSYVMEYLCPYFLITVFYYNPNISASEEYRKRAEEQKRLIAAYNAEGKGYPIGILEGDYDPGVFFETAKGYESCPEGGERCARCYELRLRETARLGKAQGFDYFCTTLSISPLKDAQKLNEIGERLAGEYAISWLPSDFKKRDGYKRSIEFSAEYGLYRQNYCGCAYSRRPEQTEET